MNGRFLAAAAAILTTAPAFAQMGTQPGTTSAGAMTSGAQATTGTAGTTAGQSTGGGVTQGATVYDPQGGTVGTIESVSGNMAVVATQRNKVQLPMSSFANGPKGPVIAMTAMQLDQAAAQAAPSQTAKPNVTQGASVTDTQGGAVGTVSEVDSQFATVTLTTGSKVRLPISAFGAGTNGALRVAATAAQLSAMGAASGSATTGAATSSGGASSSGGQ